MPRLISAPLGAALAASALLLQPLAAPAQTAPAGDSAETAPATAEPGAGITLELNNAADITQQIAATEGAEATEQTACRMTYVIANRSGESLRAATWQVGVFDGAGVVRALLLLGFGELPAGKTKIGVFDIPGWPCDDISRIIVNDVAECTPADAEPVAGASGEAGYPQSEICLTGLTTASRSDIEFGL